MQPSEQDREFIHDIRQTLEQTPVDHATTQRLNRMRHAAFVEPASQRRWLRYALPATVFAGLSAVVASFLLIQPEHQAQQLALDNIDAFEIISSTDELEMYQNLEFYWWLDEQDHSDLG